MVHSLGPMNVVDSLLQLIVSQGADALILPPGQPPSLESKGEPRALSMPYPGDEIVTQMVEDVTSADERAQLDRGDVLETTYAAADGERYVVRIEPRNPGVWVSFRRPEAEASGATEQPAPTGRSVPVVPAPSPTEAAPQPPVVQVAPTLPSPESSSAVRDAPSFHGLDNATAVTCEPGVLRDALARAVHERASDVLLSVGKAPHFRVGGEIVATRGAAVTTEAILAFVEPAMSSRAQHDLQTSGSADVAILVHDDHAIHRYRANIFRQHHGLALALRPILGQAPSAYELNLPPELGALMQLRNGLVLMTGTTGSGKSTTLVSLIEHVNRTAAKHVITIEDPIEYEYSPECALIHQRQLGSHVDTFSSGLRASLRETPDIILVGEMRDHETISAALTAAETGHLVLSTLHAGGAPMAIDRIIDVFPEHQQQQVRLQLAGVLRAVVTQVLLPTLQPPARAPAVELMKVNTAVATKIREGRGHQIQSEIQKGRGEGMISFEASLASLVQRQLISVQTAVDHAPDPTLLQQYLRGH